MTTNRQQQEAHGIGQIEEQLNRQADAAESMQGESELDREIFSHSYKDSELDEVNEP